MKPPKTKHWAIQRFPSTGLYALVDKATSIVERTHEDPRRLSDWALDQDSGSTVRHEYDLREAEEEDRERLAEAARKRAAK